MTLKDVLVPCPPGASDSPFKAVQSLLLRPPQGPAVAHLVLRVPPGMGGMARQLLQDQRIVEVSFGPQEEDQACCSVGFSFAGLEALCVPEGYLRLFRRLAPAFVAGAVRRSVHLGDRGASAAQHWGSEFHQDQAHVLVTWHGEEAAVRRRAEDLARQWHHRMGRLGQPPRPRIGRRLAGPNGQPGRWVHFGFRDGLSEVCIDPTPPARSAPDCRGHAPGVLLLGYVDDAGTNPFALGQAPDKVRGYFRDSSFGILRPMAQDTTAFDQAVDRWAQQLAGPLGGKGVPAHLHDMVRAKLCGRWPDGRPIRPDELSPPPGPITPAAMVLDLSSDPQGRGCPFGAHVRRMRAAPDAHGQVIDRPLQRRSVPFGPANWEPGAQSEQARGLLGHFFCASIEDQFEHLLGQWAAQPPLGLASDDTALDPLIGPHEGDAAALAVPLRNRHTQHLRGFGAWTTTLGTLYAWYPGASGLRQLLAHDYTPDDDEVPWL